MRRIITILIIIILIGTGVWYFYVRPREQQGMSVPAALKSFFPTSTVNNNGKVNTISTPTTKTTSTATSPFKELSAGPVAGYTIFSQSVNTPIVATQTGAVTPLVVSTGAKKTKTSSAKAAAVAVKTTIDQVVRYVARSSGYVYEIRNSAIPLQVTNVFVPNIYEASFADNDNTAILRFLQPNNQTISTFSIPIPPLNTDGTRTQKAGTHLPDDISELAVSPDQTQIARVITTSTGTTVSLSNSVGSAIKTVLHNQFQEWIPSWAGKSLYIQTKAASIANGYLYLINQSTAQLQKVVGDAPGLTASVSPSGMYVLYSESTDTGFVTKLFNTKTGATSNISLAILPEKCAWLQNEDLICAGNNSVPSGTYPDDWYSGIMHFSDQLYRITTASNVYTVLYSGQGQSFDMTNLQVDENNQLVYFIDKNTGLLWKFNY